ncbi:MAG: molybdopterin-dependent oxidoreductase, partial [Coriobacteriales bacterium]|nr:molybdopterin-dependent oxidoreductase [Coriobacteriales bacterium]
MRSVQSNCHYCGYLCGLTATVEDVEPSERYPGGERLVSLAPDPARYPYSEQIINGCRRWRMNLTEIDGPERVNFPLRRVAGTPRGSGQWERVSWDEALGDIATRLRALAAEHGPQTLATAIGGPHAVYWPLHRFMNLWGSPNNMGIGQICWNIRIWMDALAYGWPIEANIDPATTGQIFLWGTNPAESDNSLFWRTLLQMTRAGTPLVVIDPRRTRTARIATLHLAPRPGTDCVLALALIREIIARERTDAAFIERWCHGYPQLREHVEPYSLEYAEEITGIDAANIALAAEIFSAPTPTALLSGRGIDQLGPATAPTHRALSLLRAITGDVDRPGACLIMETSDFVPEIDLEMSAALSDTARLAQLRCQKTPTLQTYAGYVAATALTSRLGRTPANPEGNRLPMRYLTSAHPNLVWRAATGEGWGGEKPPYRVSALICMAANPLVTYANTALVHRALHSLELLVVLEYYLTPTAQLADFVLPSAGALERPQFQAHGGVSNFAYGGAAALAPYYERRCDYDFWRQLGCRLGQQEQWPQATLQEAIQTTLAPTGLSWQDWSSGGIYCGPANFYKHERRKGNGEPRGFATSTGKLELVSEFLVELGSTPLPEPVLLPGPTTGSPPLATPISPSAVAPPATSLAPQSPDAVPLTLITGARKQPYWASSYFN